MSRWDRHHETCRTPIRAALASARGSPGAKFPVKGPSHYIHRPTQGLLDRFQTSLAGGLPGEVATRVPVDLLGDPALIPSGLHEWLEPSAGCDSAGLLAAGSFISEPWGVHWLLSGVPRRSVSGHFPRHRRGFPTYPGHDPANRHGLTPRAVDALPLAHLPVPSSPGSSGPQDNIAQIDPLRVAGRP